VLVETELVISVLEGRLMGILEKLYILRETKLNNQINDKLTVKPNMRVIFDVIMHNDPHRGIKSIS